MRNSILSLFLVLGLIAQITPQAASAAPAVKEWTFLVFLNGHNNLDRYGAININQMEQVGSTKDVNVVVQWASAAASSTKRLLIQRDNDTHKVTSPVVQDVGKVDMGDWRSVVEFVKWAHANYPAKHYFLDIWDHGSGWHDLQINALTGKPLAPLDISFDDETGNMITTPQLGQALSESAHAIGQKIDLFASDACLMAMAELGSELSDNVGIYAGSEEVEPATGWPYDQLLKRWVAKPTASAAEVGKILAEEYVDSYQGGQNGNLDVTFSVFDLAQTGKLHQAVKALGTKLLGLDRPARKAVVTAMSDSQSFTYSDYADLGDFLNIIGKSRTVDAAAIDGAKDAIKSYVIANHVTPRYSKSSGVAMWLPSSTYTFKHYADQYKGLKFNQATDWLEPLRYVLQDADSDDASSALSLN